MAHPHHFFQRGYRSPTTASRGAVLLFALAALGWVLSAFADWNAHAVVTAIDAGESDIDFAGVVAAADYVRVTGFVTFGVQVAALFAYSHWYWVVRKNGVLLLTARAQEVPKRLRMLDLWNLGDPRPSTGRKALVAAWSWSFTAASWVYVASSVFRSAGLSAEDFRTTALFTTAIAVLGVIATALAVPIVRGISRAQADPAKFFGDAPAFAI